MNPFLIIQIVAALGSLATVFIIFNEKASESGKLLGLICFTNLFCTGGYLLEMLSRNIESAIIASKVQFVGISFWMTMLLLFVANYANFEIPGAIKFLFAFINTIFLALDFSFEYHDFFFKELFFKTYNGVSQLEANRGTGFTVFAIYNVLLFCCIIGIFIWYFKRNGRKSSKDMKCLPFAFVFQPIFVVYFLMGYKERLGYNPASIMGLLQAVFILFLVYRFRMFDSVQMAKDDIVQNLNEAYLAIDVERKLLFANDVAYSLYPELKLPDERASVINMIYRNNKKAMTIKDRHYNVSVVPFYDKRTLKGYNLWLFDKTEEHEATQRLIELKEQAEQANQAKTMFLANMSHEIRTPMNAILGTTEIILRENNSPEIEEHANSIKNAGVILLSIINDILDFSKIESGKMSAMDVEYHPGLLIRDITKDIERKLSEKGIEFQCYVKESLPSKLRGDETHVRQVFTNILNNAVKYTKTGYVRLIVDWEHQGKEGAIIRVSVEDTGCGISEESLSTLFNSFQRADMIKNRTIEGTGLGLAITKRLVESMGGTINVKSTYGEGSVFSFFISQKIVDSTPMGDFNQLSQVNISEGGGENETFIAPMAKVLAVDDNITNIKVIQGILTMYQIHVDTATSGAECLEKVEKNHYHLIFMDQMMPIMDGIETAEKIREMPDKSKRNTPIIALTANAIRGSREMFLEKGFQDYISKPMNIKVLERTLLQYLPKEFISYVDKNNPKVSLGKVISIPNVDVEKGIENYGNSRVRYIQILKYIYDDGAGQIERMKLQLQKGAYDEFHFEVHALKGLANGIGAYKLGDFSKRMELAARENNYSYVDDNFEGLINLYEMLLANIKYVLLENGVALEDHIEISDKVLSKAEFKERLNQLVQSLDMMEQQEAERQINELLATRLEDRERKILEKAKSEIKEFEYEHAIEEIVKLA